MLGIRAAGIRCKLAALAFVILSVRSVAADPPCVPADALVLVGAINTGNKPHGIACADFNGDGMLDLAVASSNSPAKIGYISGVTVHLANGPGSFNAGVDYAAPGQPFHVVAADFDLDGYIDLVTADYSSSLVSLFRGQGSGGVGSGTFSAAVNYPAGLNPSYALSADFNADGRPDLVVLNLVSGSLNLLIGQVPTGPGEGVFSAPVQYSLGNSVSYPATAAAGDFNSDGILDLVVVLYGRSQLAILFGTGSGGVGDGGFQAPIYVAVSVDPWNVEPHDLNGDGILDLAVTDVSGLGILIGSGSGGVGNGNFLPPVHYASGVFPQGMASGDFTRDGIRDFVLGLSPATRLGLFAGLGSGGVGDGGFIGPSPLAAQLQPFALLAADFTGDGRSDLAAVNYGSNTITVYVDSCAQLPAGYVVGQWAPQGEPVSVAPGDQTQPAGIADGAGGAFIAWRDGRSGAGNAIFATRINGSGNATPGWTPGGSPICTAVGDRYSPAIASDGTGGAIIGWLDTRDGTSAIYLQRVLASGSLAPGWPIDGRRLSPEGPQLTLSMDADGVGGVIIAAQDRRPGYLTGYAFRMAGDGTYPAGWTSAGKLFQKYIALTRVTVTSGPVAIGDHAGGGYLVDRYFHPAGIDFYPAAEISSLFHATDAAVSLLMQRSQQGPMPPIGGADGAGGVLAGFATSATDGILYRVSPAGTILWSAGLPLAAACQVVPDGAGGALLAASNLPSASIVAFRFTGTGAIAPGWYPSGNIVSLGANTRSLDALASDASGGAFVAWTDFRSGHNDLYATHLTGSGSLAPGWAVWGSPVYVSSGARDPATGFSDGFGGAIMVWSDARNITRDIFAQRLVSDLPVPALASLVSAESAPDRVRLTWFTPDGAAREFQIYRHATEAAWEAFAAIGASEGGEIIFEDRAVEPGRRYGYRLTVRGESPDAFMGETWIDVPLAFRLALEAPRPNPVERELNVVVTLPDERPATLDVLDVSGRAMLAKEIGGLGPGRHAFALARAKAFEPGIFFLRLRQRDKSIVEKFVVIH